MNSESVLQYEQGEKIDKSHIVFVTGHMPDRKGRNEPRFPDTIDSLQRARGCIEETLGKMNTVKPISSLVCGGTAGADLLAVQWAIHNNVQVMIFLPFSKKDFVNEAVKYGANAEYWMEIWQELSQSNMVKLVEPTGSNSKSDIELRSKQTNNPYQHYVDVNMQLLSCLNDAEQAEVLAFWDGKGGDTVGGTEHAIRLAGQSGASVSILNNGLENIAESYPI